MSAAPLWEARPDLRVGSRHVCLWPKADIARAVSNVRYGSEADILGSLTRSLDGGWAGAGGDTLEKRRALMHAGTPSRLLIGRAVFDRLSCR
jgi:hypothetical protein